MAGILWTDNGRVCRQPPGPAKGDDGNVHDLFSMRNSSFYNFGCWPLSIRNLAEWSFLNLRVGPFGTILTYKSFERYPYGPL